jgi:DNA polymerase-3 subunit gamma/tau
VLSTAHAEGLLPTILSRLRPYRFSARDKAVEAEVLRKIFRDPAAPPVPVQTYLDSFLPISGETLYPLAALFVASIAMGVLITLKRYGRQGDGSYPPTDALVSLGKYTAPIAEAAGLGRPREDIQSLVSAVLKGADNFDIRSRFSQFLQCLLTLVGESLNALPDAIACRDTWREAVREAETSVGTYNLSPAITLDRLAWELREAMAQI